MQQGQTVTGHCPVINDKCKGAQCAWWTRKERAGMHTLERCALVAIATALDAIQYQSLVKGP